MKLITRGDDAASARSANLAIREAFEGGILRNASVLACTNLLDHAYECLGSLQGLCIGKYSLNPVIPETKRSLSATMADSRLQ